MFLCLTGTFTLRDLHIVMWYATERGKGGQFPDPSLFESTGIKTER